MSLPKMTTLVTVAAGAAIGISSMALLLGREQDKAANRSTFLLRAVDILKEQPATKELLGESITVGQASLNDGWGRMEKLNVRVRLPVKGDNDNAYLYAYARKKHQNDKFRLYKLEASFGKIAGKKLVLLDKTDEEDSDDEQVEVDQVNKSHHDKQAANPSKKLSPEEAKELYKEQMKNWRPVR